MPDGESVAGMRSSHDMALTILAMLHQQDPEAPRVMLALSHIKNDGTFADGKPEAKRKAKPGWAGLRDRSESGTVFHFGGELGAMIDVLSDKLEKPGEGGK
jgi:hypothetical protein